MCSCDRPAHHGAGGWYCPPLSLDNRPDKPCYVCVWPGNVPNHLHTCLLCTRWLQRKVCDKQPLKVLIISEFARKYERFSRCLQTLGLHCFPCGPGHMFDTEIHVFLLNIKAATQICELQIRTTFETLRVIFYVPLNQQNKWLMQKYWITFMFTWAGILLICQPLV